MVVPIVRIRVKRIEPTAVSDELSAGSGERTAVSGEPSTGRLAHGDLGPNAEAVRRVLDRAAALRPDERRRLVDEAAWRSWPITVPPGGATAAAQATAATRARKAGRAQIWVVVEQAVRVALGTEHEHDRALRQAVTDAALGLAMVDLLPDDAFERLTAPWRIVMH